MIPYDDLVAALASWRARQGLPVARGAAPPAPAAPPPRAPAAAARSAPPAAPPRGAPPPAAPAQNAAADFDDGALIEESYEAAGDDYVVGFASDAVESTAIGGAPEPPRGKRTDRW